MSDVVVAGAGMAGLVAAARVRQLGAEPELREKGDRPGGNMLLSSGVVWRHRRLEDFRAECPGGREDLQRQLFERLDEALAWLEELGAPVVSRGTGNERTTGIRFEPRGLTDALVAAAGRPQLADPLDELPDRPLVLATGGFAASRELLARHVTPHAEAVLLRCTPWSTGDGLRLGLAAGGAASAGLDEIFGRAMPATEVAPEDFVRLAQLYAHHAQIASADGARHVARTWSENDVAQFLARHGGGCFSVAAERLDERTPYGTVAEAVAAAEAAGGPVRRSRRLVEVDVVAGVTSTLGGLVVDGSARVAPGVFAAGNDAGGWATGGYASGLAAALVLGLTAAESAVEAARRGERPAARTAA